MFLLGLGFKNLILCLCCGTADGKKSLTNITLRIRFPC